jgi:hypothetical protein
MPSPRRAFSLRLPPTIRETLEEIAERDGMSINRLVLLALARQFNLPKSVIVARTNQDRERRLEARAQNRRPIDMGEQPQVPGSVIKAANPPSRNGACPCGSGKKFKRCCGLT